MLIRLNTILPPHPCKKCCVAPSRGGGGETVKDIFYVTIHAGIYKSTRRTYMYNNQSLYFYNRIWFFFIILQNLGGKGDKNVD